MPFFAAFCSLMHAARTRTCTNLLPCPGPRLQVRWHSSGGKRKGIYSSPPGSFYHRHIADDLSHFRVMHLMLAGEWGLRGLHALYVL